MRRARIKVAEVCPGPISSITAVRSSRMVSVVAMCGTSKAVISGRVGMGTGAATVSFSHFTGNLCFMGLGGRGTVGIVGGWIFRWWIEFAAKRVNLFPRSSIIGSFCVG